MKPPVSVDDHKLIVVDCNFLVALSAKNTGRDDRARLDHFLDAVSKGKKKLIIPTPVIAEYLVRADAAGLEWLDTLEKRSGIEVVPFDRIAAFETAQMDRAALGAGDKRDGSHEPWQKIKIDRQIVGVAKAVGARACITSDAGLKQTALRAGVQVFSIDDLELPLSARQGLLPLERLKAGRRPKKKTGK